MGTSLEILMLVEVKIRGPSLKIDVRVREAFSSIYLIYSSGGLKGLHVLQSHI